jgi:hypothetical protein
MKDRLSPYEFKALRLLSEDTTDFLVWGYFGIGRPTLASLIKRALAETGPSRNYLRKLVGASLMMARVARSARPSRKHWRSPTSR